MVRDKISIDLVNTLERHNIGTNDVVLIDQHEEVMARNCSLDSVKLAILSEYSYMLDNNVSDDMTNKFIQRDIFIITKEMESVKIAKTIKELEQVLKDFMWSFVEKNKN